MYALSQISPATQSSTNNHITESQDDEIIVHKSTCPIKLDRKKEVIVHGKKFNVDPRELIRMIKFLTQSIGEYKRSNNPAAAYAVHALRKARGDIASDLANLFGIQFTIDSVTGESTFTL